MENMKITRKKELNKEDFQEKKAKDLMTVAQKEQHQVNWKLGQRLHRHWKKECQIISASVVTSPTFKSKASEGKAVQWVSKVLSKNPRKQKVVVKKLTIKLFPGKTIFEKKNKTKKLSLFSEGLKKNILYFYCSDTISSVGPSMKDRCICRDRKNKKIKDAGGKTMTLQKRYMCFTISETYKLFCNNNRAVEISCTSFYNQKPDFIQLWAETPVNTCTYHENMRLLTSVVEKLPDIIGLINRTVCDKNSPNWLMQECETCKNLSLAWIDKRNSWWKCCKIITLCTMPKKSKWPPQTS